jgi:hypothetical protein
MQRFEAVSSLKNAVSPFGKFKALMKGVVGLAIIDKGVA